MDCVKMEPLLLGCAIKSTVFGKVSLAFSNLAKLSVSRTVVPNRGFPDPEGPKLTVRVRAS